MPTRFRLHPLSLCFLSSQWTAPSFSASNTLRDRMIYVNFKVPSHSINYPTPYSIVTTLVRYPDPLSVHFPSQRTFASHCLSCSNTVS